MPRGRRVLGVDENNAKERSSRYIAALAYVRTVREVELREDRAHSVRGRDSARRYPATRWPEVGAKELVGCSAAKLQTLRPLPTCPTAPFLQRDGTKVGRPDRLA
jgi:hypothetical protein